MCTEGGPHYCVDLGSKSLGLYALLEVVGFQGFSE
jgi:hypothetical protein